MPAPGGPGAVPGVGMGTVQASMLLSLIRILGERYGWSEGMGIFLVFAGI